MSRGRHRGRRIGRTTIVLLCVVGVLAIGVGGTAVAAARYDRTHADRILPGISVEGIDVSGMTRAQAVAAVAAVVDERLQRQVTVTASGKTWTRTLQALGMSADVPAAVDQAFAVSDSYSWLARVYHRVFSKPISRSFDVTVRYEQAPVAALVATAAKAVAKPTVEASVALVDGTVVMRHSKTGLALKSGKATTALAAAVQAGDASVKLPVVTTQPEVADADLGRTIVVNVSKNVLYLYDGFKVIRTYPVATAMQGFVTPDGAWEVVNKVENPTWHNPAPDTWGKDEPLVIPPGPGNPLGTRALYLNAPGIRIHGTPSSSSIGTYASHGCVRMLISDSEALYPLVPVGTQVFIVGAPPWGVTTDPGAAG